jgi:S-adenosylmethionine synthetase
MKGNMIRMSEAALRGHPDKMADAIGDAVLDCIVSVDPLGRAGVQVMVTGSTVIVAGQIRTSCTVDVGATVRQQLVEIGYSDPAWGFAPDSVVVFDKLEQQTDELSANVERGGAGDSACIYGHACRETDYLVPAAYHLSQSLAVELDVERRKGNLSGTGPDGKVQIAVECDNGVPTRLHSLILSIQNTGPAALANAHTVFRDVVVPRVLPKELVDRNTQFHLRRDVGFTVGGPRADTGLSSRKVVADAYGAGMPWGGGGLSGKDPSKIDRSASYAARWIAKNVVANGLASSCDVMLSYAIGSKQPLAIGFSLDEGANGNCERLRAFFHAQDLSPTAIIDMLNLRRPIYRSLAFGGHFGRNAADYAWERVGSLLRDF